jgi:hypothetical protein
MQNEPDRRTLPLQLLDAEGRPLCRGLAIVWASQARGEARWGGEFFQLHEGEAPRRTVEGRLRDRTGKDYPVVVAAVEEVSSGGERVIRLRFGGREAPHP